MNDHEFVCNSISRLKSVRDTLETFPNKKDGLGDALANVNMSIKLLEDHLDNNTDFSKDSINDLHRALSDVNRYLDDCNGDDLKAFELVGKISHVIEELNFIEE